jgi:hypothetical protein
MVLTTKAVSHIMVLGIVISVLPISSTLIQDSYHDRFKQKTANKGQGEPIKQCGSPRNKRAQSILLPDGIPDGVSSSKADTIPVTISECTEAICKSNHDHSHRSTLLQEGGLRQWLCEAVSEYLSSWDLAQVDLSIFCNICRKIVLGRNVCNCSSAVDSVLDACDQ